ncbi:MAG TPA: T9SS type A sorting domain-containing protein [Flavipsychrobacter sp.]|nr:T9SS type A sorting domain-containing protein [Flavipsychrobacter sp.]
MRKYIILIWLAALHTVPQPSFGQVFFHSLFDHDSTGDWGWDIKIKDNGNYFLQGTGFNFATGELDQFRMDVSADGSQLLNKRYIHKDNFGCYMGSYGRVKELTGNGYVMPYILKNVYSNKILAGMMRLDAQGDTLFTRIYTDTLLHNEDVHDITVLPDGGYILGGGIKYPPNYQFYNSVVYRTDSNGNVLWRQTYPAAIWNHQSYVNSLQYIGSNTVLVGSFSGALHSHGIGSQVLYYYHFAPWFKLMDLQGNIIKDTFFSEGYIGEGNIFKDVNGGFFHWGLLDTFITNDPLNFQNLPGYIEKLDDSFRVVWKKRLGDSFSHIDVANVKQTQDDNYLAVGCYQDMVQIGLRGWAAKLDKNGFVMWEHTYAVPHKNWNEAYLVDFAERPDKSIVMCGNTRSDTVDLWRGYDAWLLSVDSNGCEIPGCNPNFIKELKHNPQSITVYPNPTTGEFMVESKDEGSAVISDLQGRVIERIHIAKGKNPMSLPACLVAGVYLLQYRNEKGAVNVKLVKE